MADSKVDKQVGTFLKAQERLGVTLVKERDKKRKRRDGRLLKLGVLAEQMFLAGDLTLLGRFEDAALAQFKDRKVDRLDFELDEPFNWFDKTREEAMVAKAEKGEPAKGPSAPPSTSPASPATPGKAASSAASRPASNGAAGTNGAASPATPNSAVSV